MKKNLIDKILELDNEKYMLEQFINFDFGETGRIIESLRQRAIESKKRIIKTLEEEIRNG